MVTAAAEVASQLRDELAGAVAPLAVLAGPDAVRAWPGDVARHAATLAAQLVQDGDDRLAAETVLDVMAALWPHGSPEDVGRSDWWRTPLGRACARSLGRTDAEAVSYSAAAAMLGVTKATVQTLVTRGRLDRHPDGAVLRASVLQRLGQATA